MKTKIITLLFCGLTVCAYSQNTTFQQRAKKLCNEMTLEEKTSLMMDNSPAIPRLGIPAFQWWNEALHGVARNGLATVFPQTIGMAASFDPALLQQVYTAVSDEARAKAEKARQEGSFKRYQGLSFWTPNINIFRDPRWGRGQETYGEDPYLTSQMGLAVVRGLQGPEDAPYRKLLACAKHFAVHSGPENLRHQMDIEDLPPRDLWETYLPAFKTLVEQGHVAEVMCAYQRFEGQPCCGNNRLLQQILRDEWHFKGLVVSDCGAIGDFWRPGRHGYAPDAATASAKAVSTGTDVECGSNYKHLGEAVKAGLIPEAKVDSSVVRLLTARFSLGDIDTTAQVSWRQIPFSTVDSRGHRELALQMARETIVLLQNKKNILPLNPQQQFLVVGANATDSTMQWGNYNGIPSHTTTILQGIQSLAPQTVFIGGCGLVKDSASWEAIGQEARHADAIIFVGGLSPRLEGEEMKVNAPGFNGGDRTTIELPEAQRAAIRRLTAMGKPVILVNCSGSAVGLVPESKHCAAILQAWYPGEEGGRAVSEILFGKVNPSGKLPVTFYRDDRQLPPFTDYHMKGRTYRYFKGKPLFAFGHGLSYTMFRLSKPEYKDRNIRMMVSNTGKCAGTEVIQVYVKRTADTDGPIKSLKAFRRVTLQSGETQTVTIPLSDDAFTSWDPQSNTMRPMPGPYKFFVGTSSDNVFPLSVHD